MHYYKHDWINLPPNQTFVDNLMDQEHFTAHDDKQMCLLLFSTMKESRAHSMSDFVFNNFISCHFRINSAKYEILRREEYSENGMSVQNTKGLCEICWDFSVKMA